MVVKVLKSLLLGVNIFIIIYLGYYLSDTDFFEETLVYNKINQIKLNSTGNENLNSIIRINSNGMFICSGTVISDNYVLTASHCIRNQPEDFTVTSDNLIYTTKAVRVISIPNQDVGLLSGDFSMFKKLKVRWDKLHLGLPYINCGYPRGQQKLQCGPINLKSNTFFRISGDCVLVQGMSGGPVIDALTEEVVGVNSAVDYSGCIIGPLLGLKHYIFGE